MNEQTKVACYQKIYKEAKGIQEIENLGYPKKRTNYDFYFSIGLMQVVYSLKRMSDLLSIRASVSIPEYISDDDARQFCKELLTDSIYHGYADNKIMTITYSVPVIGVSDNVAADKIYESALDFFHFLCDKKNEIELFFTKEDAGLHEDKEIILENENMDSEEGMPDPDTEDMIVVEPVEDQKESEKKENVPENEPELHKDEDKSAEMADATSEEPDAIFEEKNIEKKEKEDSLVEKRVSFEKFCHTQMQEIERRMNNAKELEKNLDERFVLLAKKTQDLNAFEEKLHTQKEKNEQRSKELEERELLTSELENKEKRIAILEDTMQAREDELRRNSLFATLSGSKERSSVEEKDYKKKINTIKEENVSLHDQVEKLCKEQIMLQEKNALFERSLVSQREEKEKINELYHQLQSKLKKTEGELMKEQNSMKLGVDISLFEEYGYSVKEIIGEKEGLYTIYSSTIPNDIKITIDTIHGIALFQKSLRRGKKYGQTVWGWNQESFCSSYILNGNEILVKKQLGLDLDAEIKEVVDKLNVLI